MSHLLSSTSTDVNLSNTNQSLSQMNLVSVETTSTRPTSLVVSSTTIDNIHITPSPIDNRPRYFRPGSIIDDTTYHRISNSVTNKEMNFDMDEENVTQNDTQSSNLSNIIHMEKPVNDPIADALVEYMDQTNEVYVETDDNVTESENESESDSVIVTTSHPYPPINRTGQVADHDRPFADYGHLDASTIATEFKFNLETIDPKVAQSSSRGVVRMDAKSWAITCWTHVSKETVLNEIKRQFGLDRLQYVCVAQEMKQPDMNPHLHIQIILKVKTNKRKWFLDHITGTHCNYQVTHSDRAWNEYIKKGLNYVEMGSFNTISTYHTKQWPTVSSTSDNITTIVNQVVTEKQKSAEQRRQFEKEIAEQAFELARTDVQSAMALIQKVMPTKFFAHSNWYHYTFKYINSTAKSEAMNTGDVDKDLIWPLSFPDCTSKLREAINDWITKEFSLTSRARCLVIIGPTGTGKTSFALSLPGRVNYSQGRWMLDDWNDQARYSVYDDIPWDEFEKRGFPEKRSLLTQQLQPLKVTDRYRTTKLINVRQPAIVLMNIDAAGSLLAEPTTQQQINVAAYWKERTFIYIMGPDEYFHRKSPNQNRITTNDASNVNSPTTAGYHMRLGEPDEFERMEQRFLQRQRR